MIVLFTDFGLTGPYTGQMKAVLAREAPGVPVIDLFADAPAFEPMLCAYLLDPWTRWFPPGTVVLAVVDPGVGTQRPAVVVEADDRWYVGPGNGLFEAVMRRAARPPRAWEITWRPDALSASFHGRDLFAPVAAGLALPGRPAAHALEPLDPARLRRPDWPDDLARIVYVDGYGNAMTGLRAETLSSSDRLRCPDGTVVAHAPVFGAVPPGAGLWYGNSGGLVEIAVNQGRAADLRALTPGSPLVVERCGDPEAGRSR